jgi:hypothetical protein
MRFSDSSEDPSFLWAFEPNCIDALSAGWSAAGKDDFPLLRKHYSLDIFNMPEDFLRTVSVGEVHELWGGASVLSLHTHAGISHHLLRNPHYADWFAAAGLTVHNAYAEAYHFLLRPRAAGLTRFRSEVAALTDEHTVRIGIHVRTGVHYDKSFEPGAPSFGVSDFLPFFSCAQQVETALLQTQRLTGLHKSRFPHTQWLLLSDSIALRENAQERFSEKMVERTKGVTVRHSRTSTLATPFAANVSCLSFLDAAMEHWLFGLADAHVVSQWSGFGRTGALVHLRGDARVKPMFQLSASKPVPADCALVAASPIDEITGHPPGV